MTDKRKLASLTRRLEASRLPALADWYARNKPTVDLIAITPALADVLDACPQEAADLGILPLGDGRPPWEFPMARRYTYAHGRPQGFLLYPHGGHGAD